jgi:macrolide-specific efflux system membrane fusion protein
MKSMKWWMEDYKKYRTGIAIFVVLFAFIFTAGCSIFPKEAEEEEIPKIEPPKISKKPEMTVTKGDIVIKAKGTGQVYSKREEYLYFLGSEDEQQSGGQQGGQSESFRIKKIYVEPGQTVKAGQVMAELVTKDLDLMIEESENMLKIEEQKLILKLREEPTTDEERIEQEQLKADFRKKQLEHQKLVRQLQNSQIVAPFDGQVASVFYNSGDQVKAFDPVILLIDMNNLVVGVRMSETDQKQLSIGQEADVEITGVNAPLKGKIIKMPSVNQEQNSGDYYGGFYPGDTNNKIKDERNEMVLIDVGKLPADVKRGAVANASFVLQKKENVVKIPLSFLHTYGDRNYVVVTDAQGKREVDVELGLRSATEVEIVSGITAGIRIVGR